MWHTQYPRNSGLISTHIRIGKDFNFPNFQTKKQANPKVTRMTVGNLVQSAANHNLTSECAQLLESDFFEETNDVDTCIWVGLGIEK